MRSSSLDLGAELGYIPDTGLLQRWIQPIVAILFDHARDDFPTAFHVHVFMILVVLQTVKDLQII